MNNPQTPYSKVVVVDADGTPRAWFDDADDALLYVAGQTETPLGVFVTTRVSARNGRSIIHIQLGQ